LQIQKGAAGSSNVVANKGGGCVNGWRKVNEGTKLKENGWEVRWREHELLKTNAEENRRRLCRKRKSE